MVGGTRKTTSTHRRNVRWLFWRLSHGCKTLDWQIPPSLLLLVAGRAKRQLLIERHSQVVLAVGEPSSQSHISIRLLLLRLGQPLWGGRKCAAWRCLRLYDAWRHTLTSRQYNKVDKQRQNNEQSGKNCGCLAQEIRRPSDAEHRPNVASTEGSGKSAAFAGLHENHYRQQDADNNFNHQEKCIHTPFL